MESLLIEKTQRSVVAKRNVKSFQRSFKGKELLVSKKVWRSIFQAYENLWTKAHDMVWLEHKQILGHSKWIYSYRRDYVRKENACNDFHCLDGKS